MLVCLFVCLFLGLFIHLVIYSFILKSGYVSMRLKISLWKQAFITFIFICLSVCLSSYLLTELQISERSC